jgi:hypothetical protein
MHKPAASLNAMNVVMVFSFCATKREFDSKLLLMELQRSGRQRGRGTGTGVLHDLLGWELHDLHSGEKIQVHAKDLAFLKLPVVAASARYEAEGIN